MKLLRNGLLVKLTLAITLVLALCFVNIPPEHQLWADTSLNDNFLTDMSLNTNLWQVNGPVGTLVGIHLSDIPDTIVTPTITFSPTYGMGVSGVTSDYQAATIQSVQSFSSPFTLTASVTSTLAYAQAFVLGISTADGNQGVVIAGEPSTTSGYLGIWYQTATGINNGWTFFQGPIVPNPSINVIYQLEISVDSSGMASLSVSSQGNMLGTASVQVGAGNFYIILGQREGLPDVSGPNQAYWESVNLQSGITPTITCVSPNTGMIGNSSIAIMISGTNFNDATAVNFGSGITVTNFTVYSPTRITGDINIGTSATVGLRDISVTTSSGVATLSGGFRVKNYYFTIVQIPDIQNQCQYYWNSPNEAEDQADWIAAHKTDQNIVLACYVGDMVNSFDGILFDDSSQSQWVPAVNAIKHILGSQVPVIISPGNHDQFEDGNTNNPFDDSYFNSNFPCTLFSNSSSYGSSYPGGTYDNSYYLIPNSLHPNFIVLAIGFYGETDSNTWEWANGVLNTYATTPAIIVTHSYLQNNDYPDPKTAEGTSLWDNVLKYHGNVFLVLCGHSCSGNGYPSFDASLPDNERLYSQTGNLSNNVTGILVDFQNYVNGGDGYFRIYEFDPATSEVDAYTYSPTENNYDSNPNSSFSFEEPSITTGVPTTPGGCFIATAAYGTPMAKDVQTLREFRDQYLLTNPVGQALVGLYYKISPPIAEFITEHPTLKPIVRAGLVPAVAMSTVVVNTTAAEKAAIIGLVVLVSVVLAVWATRRRRGPEYT